MTIGNKRTFEVEEVENGFIITDGERRFVSSREPAELLKGLASILGVDAGGAKVARKKRGPNTKLPAGAAV